MKFYKRQEKLRWLTVVVVFLVVGYSNPTSAQSTADPIQPFNRAIYSFNDGVDKILIRPLAVGYRKFIPARLRSGVNNFFNNLRAPTTLINDVLQGKPSRAKETVDRFLINSTIGIGGLFDVATAKKIKYRHEDFGQTFATYGVGQGPYLILPFLGPSSFRNGFGLITRKLVDPLSFNAFEVGGKRELLDSETLISLTIIEMIDKRESLIEIVEDARKDSFDFYATVRSAYTQKRDFEINNK